MRILISIEHPAWAYQFRYIIKELETRGHQVKVVAIDKDGDLELLDRFGIAYVVVGDSTGKTFLEKVMIFLAVSFRIFRLSLAFRPQVFIGRASPMMAVNSRLFGKKHIIYEDTERAVLELIVCKWCAYRILTPVTFKTDFGEKQVRVQAYKELFYLHPSRFQPDPSVLQDEGLCEGERFIFVRFVAWHASHDLGHGGLSREEKVTLVKTCEQHGRVLVSSEGPLPPELEKYKVRVPFDMIHHLLYFAALYIGEGATMASEAAVLGTHALFISELTAGTTEEQEQRYELLFNISNRQSMLKDALQKASDLLVDEALWKKGKMKRQKLLNEKVDLSEHMINLIAGE